MWVMPHYVARPLRFQNGLRTSVLIGPDGLPVHEATLFLDRLLRRGAAANTIHYACKALALAHHEMRDAQVDMLGRFAQGRFLTSSELTRLANATRYRLDELDEPAAAPSPRGRKVISIRDVHPKLKASLSERSPVAVNTQASRLRYIIQYLGFLSDYAKASLSKEDGRELTAETTLGLSALKAQIPIVPSRTKVGAREGLSMEVQDELLGVLRPDSPRTPWKSKFVRKRNWLIVVLLLATGMRKGELLGLRISDFASHEPKLRILRRPDKQDDPRPNEPNTKTGEREIELAPAIMRELWRHINEDRYAIKAARKYPQLFVADDGNPLSGDSVSKLFQTLRKAVPDLPRNLTSHVMRHTWNERFSEQADELGIPAVEEQRARNEQQGWAYDSKTSKDYTRRHTAKKGRELSLLLQKKLDEHLNEDE